MNNQTSTIPGPRQIWLPRSPRRRPCCPRCRGSRCPPAGPGFAGSRPGNNNIFIDEINLLMSKKHLFRFVVEGAADVPHGRDNFSISKEQFSFPPPPHLPPELDGWDHHWRKHGECCHLSQSRPSRWLPGGGWGLQQCCVRDFKLQFIENNFSFLFQFTMWPQPRLLHVVWEMTTL